MVHPSSDSRFAGSVPKAYEELLVPLIFEPYAEDLAQRVLARGARQVLETAAGTGVVTRAMARLLPPDARIVATDLNAPMLEQGARRLDDPRVRWQVADAMQLPFEDASVDAVVCQFGVMFMPRQAQAFAEARRVLRPGGWLLFNVWDRLQANGFAEVVTRTLEGLWPQDPPLFLERTPHGHGDPGRLAHRLREAGFDAAACMETVVRPSRADDPRTPAAAYCLGTPLRHEIEQRSGHSLDEAIETCARAIERRYGRGPVEAPIQALVVEVQRIG